jgi:hypothetical protein
MVSGRIAVATKTGTYGRVAPQTGTFLCSDLEAMSSLHFDQSQTDRYKLCQAYHQMHPQDTFIGRELILLWVQILEHLQFYI